MLQPEHHHFRYKTANLDLRVIKQCFIGMSYGMYENKKRPKAL
jgi:hypothetical protein